MARNLISSEEIRDVVALKPGSTNVRALATELAVSEPTVRRHLNVLIERGHVRKVVVSGRASYRITPKGALASEENEGL